MTNGPPEVEIAFRHVREGHARIATQMRIIAELNGAGLDTSRAEKVLATLQEAQKNNEKHLGEIRARVRERFTDLMQQAAPGYAPPPLLKRSMIEDHLEQAERHVAVGERIVAEQRARIAQLERDGHDVTRSRELLGQFEEILAMQIAHRDRLRSELERSSEG